MRVAFAGLGVMGYPMAGYLAKNGHEVVVYNRTSSRADDWCSPKTRRLDRQLASIVFPHDSSNPHAGTIWQRVLKNTIRIVGCLASSGSCTSNPNPSRSRKRVFSEQRHWSGRAHRAADAQDQLQHSYSVPRPHCRRLDGHDACAREEHHPL